MRPGIKKGVPRLLDVNRQPGKPTKKRRKVTLVFDESKRKDFLTGFQKRKLERRQKASEQLKTQLKEEKKRIKQEARERFKNYVSQRDVPELEELLSKQAEYEDDGKTVSILELNVNELAQSSNWIGENKPACVKEESESEASEEENNPDSVPGMDFVIKKEKKKIINDKTSSDKKKSPMDKKDITRARQKETLKQTGRSKVFQLKERLDRQKNKKLSKKKQFKEEKSLKNAKGKTKRKMNKKKATSRKKK